MTMLILYVYMNEEHHICSESMISGNRLIANQIFIFHAKTLQGIDFHYQQTTETKFERIQVQKERTD
jgi:hypothetical protein